MNTRPINQALDADLRLSMAALERAAQRARVIAAQTGTAIVVCHDGIIEHIPPQYADTAASPALSVQEPSQVIETKA
jgi:cytochrome c551/c552